MSAAEFHEPGTFAAASWLPVSSPVPRRTAQLRVVRDGQGTLHVGVVSEEELDEGALAGCVASFAASLDRERHVAPEGWRTQEEADVRPVELVLGVDPSDPSEEAGWGPGYLFEPLADGCGRPASETEFLEVAVQYLDAMFGAGTGA